MEGEVAGSPVVTGSLDATVVDVRNGQRGAVDVKYSQVWRSKADILQGGYHRSWAWKARELLRHAPYHHPLCGMLFVAFVIYRQFDQECCVLKIYVQDLMNWHPNDPAGSALRLSWVNFGSGPEEVEVDPVGQAVGAAPPPLTRREKLLELREAEIAKSGKEDEAWVRRGRQVVPVYDKAASIILGRPVNDRALRALRARLREANCTVFKGLVWSKCPGLSL